MRGITAVIALSFASLCFADTVTLRSGRVISGTYLGGTARTVRIDDGVNVRTIDVTDVVRIEFGGDSFETSNRSGSDRPTLRRTDPDTVAERPSLRRTESGDSDPDRPALRRSDNVMRPDSQAPPPPVVSGTLPAGTNLVIRMIEAVDSETARVGQSFRASMDQPVMLDGQTVIYRGADVTVKLVDVKDSGRLTGRADLALVLQSVRINGRFVDLNTQTINKESGSQGERTAKVAGGTAAVGAIIGAIAGGGKGAAIGAGAGAAAGAGSQVIMGGQRVRIPPRLG